MLDSLERSSNQESVFQNAREALFLDFMSEVEPQFQRPNSPGQDVDSVTRRAAEIVKSGQHDPESEKMRRVSLADTHLRNQKHELPADQASILRGIERGMVLGNFKEIADSMVALRGNESAFRNVASALEKDLAAAGIKAPFVYDRATGNGWIYLKSYGSILTALEISTGGDVRPVDSIWAENFQPFRRPRQSMGTSTTRELSILQNEILNKLAR